MFVGHEPDLSAAMSLLTGAASVRMRKGGIGCVEFPGSTGARRAASWPGCSTRTCTRGERARRATPGHANRRLRAVRRRGGADPAGAPHRPARSRPAGGHCPGGGIDFGEAPAEAVLRELTEETGLTGEVESLAGVESWVRRGSSPGGIADDFQAIQIIYRVRVTGGTLTNEVDGSTDAAAWFTREELAAAADRRAGGGGPPHPRRREP